MTPLKRSERTIWFRVELGGTLNIEKVEGSSKFLDWARTPKLDIGIRELWPLEVGPKFWLNMDLNLGLCLGALKI